MFVNGGYITGMHKPHQNAVSSLMPLFTNPSYIQLPMTTISSAGVIRVRVGSPFIWRRHRVGIAAVGIGGMMPWVIFLHIMWLSFCNITGCNMCVSSLPPFRHSVINRFLGCPLIPAGEHAHHTTLPIASIWTPPRATCCCTLAVRIGI